MMSQSLLHLTRCRHANYYLRRLQQITHDYQEGGDLIMPALAAFEKDWIQMQTAQDWVAHRVTVDKEAAEICKDFAHIGGTLLYLRRSPTEQLQWMAAGQAAAHHLQNPASEGEHLTRMGDAYLVISDYEKALDCFTRALDIAKRVDNHLVEAAALNGLGRYYKRLGRYQEVADCDEKARLLLADNNRTHDQANINQAGGLVLQGRYEEAIRALTPLLATGRLAGNWQLDAELKTNLGVAYIGLERYRKAIPFFEQALPLIQKLGWKESESIILAGLANSYHFLGSYQEASTYYEAAIQLTRVMNSRDLEASHLFNLGAVYMQLGQNEKALDAYEQAEKLFTPQNPNQAAAARQQINTLTHGSKAFLALLRVFTRIVHRAKLHNKVLRLKKHVS